MTTNDRCPGCAAGLDESGDCPRCEYANLASGRYHYCGRDSCHCANLRGTMKRSVLDGFALQFAEKHAGRTYSDMAREQLLGPRP